MREPQCAYYQHAFFGDVALGGFGSDKIAGLFVAAEVHVRWKTRVAVVRNKSRMWGGSEKTAGEQPALGQDLEQDTLKAV